MAKKLKIISELAMFGIYSFNQKKEMYALWALEEILKTLGKKECKSVNKWRNLWK